MANINWRSAKAMVARISAGVYNYCSLDALTNWLVTIGGPHHEIHEGDAFAAFYVNTTSSDDLHRSGLYFKTPAAASGRVHAIFSVAASHAATYTICEAVTLAANEGTAAVPWYNRFRGHSNKSGCLDNATVNAVDKFTTMVEADFDVTWDTGVELRSAPILAGQGPKAIGGVSRGAQEWVLDADTRYVLMITNVGANANTHYMYVDQYEHTDSN